MLVRNHLTAQTLLLEPIKLLPWQQIIRAPAQHRLVLQL